MSFDDMTIEQGPIRPPSEAASLLIRATRNCPWNRCAFCHCYRGTSFELRPVDEIKKDIETARRIADEIKVFSWKMGEGGRVSRSVVAALWQHDGHGIVAGMKNVAAWLYYGGESVFLQDANSLIMKTDDLVEVLRCIRENFPSVCRITTYGRSQSAVRKTIEEYRALRDAGLSRIHIGLESGSDHVLKFMRKGVTAAQHIEGGQCIVKGGISLSEYVMPGLGGSEWSEEHARETARVINAINPAYVRIRSLQVVPGTDLARYVDEGSFSVLADDDVVRELRLFIEHLDGIESTIISDHILNLLQELEGVMPGEKKKMLGVIDRYLSLSDRDRQIFRLGRRRGVLRSTDDLHNGQTYDALKRIVDSYAGEPGELDRNLRLLMSNYI